MRLLKRPGTKIRKNTSDLAAIIVTGYDDLSAAGRDLTMP
jgi:hypothetical protein